MYIIYVRNLVISLYWIPSTHNHSHGSNIAFNKSNIILMLLQCKTCLTSISYMLTLINFQYHEFLIHVFFSICLNCLGAYLYSSQLLLQFLIIADNCCNYKPPLCIACGKIIKTTIFYSLQCFVISNACIWEEINKLTWHPLEFGPLFAYITRTIL